MNWLFGGLGYLLGRGAAAGGSAAGAGAAGGCAGCFANILSMMVLGVFVVAGIKGCEQEKRIENNDRDASRAWVQMLTVDALPAWQRSNPNIKSIEKDSDKAIDSGHYSYTYDNVNTSSGQLSLDDGRVVARNLNDMVEWYDTMFFNFTVTYNNGTSEEVYFDIVAHDDLGSKEHWAEKWRSKDTSLINGYFVMRRDSDEGSYDSRTIARIDRLGDISGTVARIQQEKNLERIQSEKDEADFRRAMGPDYNKVYR